MNRAQARTFPVLVLALTAAAMAQVPMGWTWNVKRPFTDLTVTASSEQADRWPAGNAVDGDTSEPEGIWQTLRDSPKSAWLELELLEPQTVKGVRIFHQKDAGYYRSVDYTISCWVDGDWREMAAVEGNTTTGWRDHPFDPVDTNKVRIDIAKSEHGFRMGLNEVEVVIEPEASAPNALRTLLSKPYRCGEVGEMGILEFSAQRPTGTGVSIATRTAPDEGGKPGAWSDWSAPCTDSAAPITSPVGEWIQCQATFEDAGASRAIVEEMTLGWPDCIDQIDTGCLIAEPGKPLALAVHFNQSMDRASGVNAELKLAGQEALALSRDAWDDAGRTWTFSPAALGSETGLAEIVVGGARSADGFPALHRSTALAVGSECLLARLRGIADWMMANPHKAIFVEGYNQRTILGLHEITGEQRYLDHVRKWVEWLLAYQKPEGYWPTGYGDVYFADTGSALGLLINFYKYGRPEEKAGIDTALQRYADLLLVRGDSQGRPFVHDDGSLGVGYNADKEGEVTGDLNEPYTISTALTGAEIFGAMYYMTGDEHYKDIAVKACDWLLDTMDEDGRIPYYIDDWNPGRKDEHWVWERWPYDTSAYAGEGFLAAWTYIDDPAFRRDLGERVRPHIEWLLRTQNADGSWARKGSGDQLRSHGVVNLLLWYNEHVQPDPRITTAIRRWYALVLDEEQSAYLKVPGDGIATSLAGRALLEIIQPGVDCYRWEDDVR
jgi:F5/8 type C domain